MFLFTPFHHDVVTVLIPAARVTTRAIAVAIRTPRACFTIIVPRWQALRWAQAHTRASA
jgi:hypothetical protein